MTAPPLDSASLVAQLRRRGSAGLAQDCRPAAEILARVGDKWGVLVVMLLGHGPCRFNEMKRLIGGISQRMLTLTLRGLERDGLVTRTVRAAVPPHVDYALTSLGDSLRQPIAALGQWAYANHQAIAAARARFDRHLKES